MKATTLIVGIVLIVLGLATLGYEGFSSFSTKESTVSVPDGQTTAGSKTTIPLRPIAAGLALACGFVLVLVSNKKAATQYS
jgi:drug/metabolite transporter (DMT)-like permease